MKARGITFVTVLVLLAAVGAVFWGLAYGPAYWDNFEVNRIVRQAANMCYRESTDEPVRRFILVEMSKLFPPGPDQPKEQQLSVDLDPTQDVRIERTDAPKVVNIWVTYRRTITLPVVGGQREVAFTDHAEQDLSPVKW